MARRKKRKEKSKQKNCVWGRKGEEGAVMWRDGDGEKEEGEVR